MHLGSPISLLSPLLLVLAQFLTDDGSEKLREVFTVQNMYRLRPVLPANVSAISSFKQVKVGASMAHNQSGQLSWGGEAGALAVRVFGIGPNTPTADARQLPQVVVGCSMQPGLAFHK